MRHILEPEYGNIILMANITVLGVDVDLVYAVSLKEVVEVSCSLAAPHHHP